ncbi:hypothetical protein NVIE_1790 [Nitrososphaera viennensis EN76]|uniref:Uncharacterized protein n=1 Tax=Nitrososphaera viennensis EN76 TaxID=926571 RepID=A0A060HLB3_9ARCH|nr:hypothetical protein NVIE_1790 [Nitrososphaera viennensis EN76]
MIQATSSNTIHHTFYYTRLLN